MILVLHVTHRTCIGCFTHDPTKRFAVDESLRYDISWLRIVSLPSPVRVPRTALGAVTGRDAFRNTTTWEMLTNQILMLQPADFGNNRVYTDRELPLQERISQGLCRHCPESALPLSLPVCYAAERAKKTYP